MKLNIKTAALKTALASASKVIQKSPSDIMMAAHISCVDQDIIVSAASAHANIRINTGENFDKAFAFAVNAERLKQLVDRADSETLKLDIPADDSQPISISGGVVRGKIKQLPAANFPGITEPRDMRFEIPELAVAKVLPALRWAAAPSLAMPVQFQGVTFLATAGQLRIACISGIAACFWTEEAKFEAAAYAGISLISAGIVSSIFDECAVYAYANRMVFERGDVRVGVPLLISGADWPLASKMPKVDGENFGIDRAKLTDAVRVCNSMGKLSGGKTVVVEVSSVDDGLKFSADGADGEIELLVPTEGEAKMNGWINGAQMLSAISACHADNLTFTVPAENGKPFKVSVGNWEAVIAPMKP